MSLLFVYNANSGLAAALFDSAHKFISPQTYACNLCTLTHGLAGPKREWSAFLKSLPESPVFLHRDEFLKSHPDQAGTPLPAIFKHKNPDLELVADGNQLARMKNLDELTRLVAEASAADPPNSAKG